MTEWGHPIGQDDLQAFVDDCLPPSRRAAVLSYLEAHPDIAKRIETYRRQTAALRTGLRRKVDEPIPPRLRVAHLVAARRAARRRRLLRVAAVLAWFTLGGAAGWIARGEHEPVVAAAPAGLLTADAIAAHRTYVVEVRHPVEVAAAEETHLVQWLSKRLGRALKVPNLARQGYHLVGGRLLPAEAGPAAQLMYEDGAGQRLTVYLRADQDKGETSFRFAQEGGVGAFYWVEGGFGYAVTAAADRPVLLQVAEAVYRQTLDTATP